MNPDSINQTPGSENSRRQSGSENSIESLFGPKATLKWVKRLRSDYKATVDFWLMTFFIFLHFIYTSIYLLIHLFFLFSGNRYLWQEEAEVWKYKFIKNFRNVFTFTLYLQILN